MRMPKNLGRRAILAGAGMALAGSVIGGAADAATSGSDTHSVNKSTRVADYNVSVRTDHRYIDGQAAIKDRTSGADFVAVQVFLQRWTGEEWRTVVRGPREAGDNHAVSTTGIRGCSPGRYYRAFAHYNWDNRSHWSSWTRPVVC